MLQTSADAPHFAAGAHRIREERGYKGLFFSRLRKDIAAAKKNDPAARNKFEIWLTYSGVHALSWHRWANRLYRMHLKLLARMTSQFAKFLTGIEIHPAARIAPGVFIDHGAGVVIGETAEVEEGVVIYQGVTLGGTGKEKGKRHPTIRKNAVISCGAKVLGGFTVGEGARIGAGAVVLKEVPPYATVVGVPGRVVRINGEKTQDLLPDKDDPILREVCSLRERIYELEDRLETVCGRLSRDEDAAKREDAADHTDAAGISEQNEVKPDENL